jgi:osmotically-inducible protein OsmY
MTKSKYFRMMGFALTLTGLMAGCATERPFEENPADAKITADILSQFDQRPDFEPNAITVQTVDHVVYLNGLVASDVELSDATAIADKVPGVERVESNVGVEN